ncbi:MAG: FAD:protein FMN transferase [Gammaproteobacteria bacterium]|nr:FAD:protein FMN transferase [Gammaproteobacteria bacterium]
MEKVLVFSLLALFLSACGKEQISHTIVGSTMGTTFSIVIAHTELDQKKRQAFETDINTLLDEINQKMSTYREDSEVSRFNRWQQTDWFVVSQETAKVVNAALRISELSGGVYDITMSPLIELWGFGKGERRQSPPTAGAIADAKDRIGYASVVVRDDLFAIRKTNSKITINLSSIAKGYAVNAVADFLEEKGLDHFLVEIGGELKGKGFSPSNRSWRVGIEQPLAGERVVQQIIEVKNNAIATSGDYRNYFEEDGVRYSHILDAQTGRPITHKLASVTVILPSAMEADGWATALLILGHQAGLALAREEQIPAFFVLKTKEGFQAHYTKLFSPFLVN